MAMQSRSRWLSTLCLLLCACSGSAGDEPEPDADTSTRQPTPQQPGRDSDSEPDSDSDSEPDSDSEAQDGYCQAVFADPLPASMSARGDDGPRGLLALRREVSESLERWKQLNAEHGGRYSYTRLNSSFVGWTARTTVHVEGGAVTSRAQLFTPRGAKAQAWVETGAEVGAHTVHPDSLSPALALDELYALCLTRTLCSDPRTTALVVELDERGLLRQCTSRSLGCQDDCTSGVVLEAVRVGDDAPECCAIADRPSCCMMYGGAKYEGGNCGATCDGMPPPSAAWTVDLDAYGCPHWIEPERSDVCCGCPPPSP